MADTELNQEAIATEEQPAAEEATATEKLAEETAQEEKMNVDAAGDAGDSATATTDTNGDSAETGNGEKPADAAAGDADGDKSDEEDEDDRKLFVGGLSWETQQNGLKDFMVQFGEVESCVIKKDNATGRSRCFGFVVFKEIAGLDKALEGRPHKVDGRKIDSKKAQPQPKKEIKLFVGGVKPETEEETIKAYFSEFGEVVKIDRPKEGGRDGKKFKAFCFVTFKKDSTVAKVTKNRYHKLDDKEVECKEADPPKSMMGGPGGRGRGGGGRGGYPFMGGPGNFRFQGGYPPAPYGYDMGFGFGGGYGNMPYGGYGGGGGGGFGYGQQQSGFGKAGRGGRGNSYKPY